MFQGDTLRTRIDLEPVDPLDGGGGLLHLRARVKAGRGDGSVDEVLDWRPIGLMA